MWVMADRRWGGDAACERTGVLLIVGLHCAIQPRPRLLCLPLRVSMHIDFADRIHSRTGNKHRFGPGRRVSVSPVCSRGPQLPMHGLQPSSWGCCRYECNQAGKEIFSRTHLFKLCLVLVRQDILVYGPAVLIFFETILPLFGTLLANRLP